MECLAEKEALTTAVKKCEGIDALQFAWRGDAEEAFGQKNLPITPSAINLKGKIKVEGGIFTTILVPSFQILLTVQQRNIISLTGTATV